MSAIVRVYVNGRGVDVPATATVLEAVRAYKAEAAGELERGACAIVDSRGLPAALDSAVHGGAIFRVVRCRGVAASAVQ